MTTPVVLSQGPVVKQPQAEGSQEGSPPVQGPAPSPSAVTRLPVFAGKGGLVDGVNPSCNASMLDALGDATCFAA
jgi:hypothetical protein